MKRLSKVLKLFPGILDGLSDVENTSGFRRLAEVRTTFSSGRVDVLTYSYDDRGFPASVSIESEAFVPFSYNFVFNSEGFVDRLESDTGSNKTIDSTSGFIYEGDRLIVRNSDGDLDQIPDSVRTHNFDDLGRYIGYADPSSESEWIYEDALCDTGWQGRVFDHECIVVDDL